MSKNIFKNLPTIAAITDDLRARRAERVRIATLRAELSTYRSPGEIEDLLAAADRTTDPDAELVRSILTDNLQAFHARQYSAA